MTPPNMPLARRRILMIYAILALAAFAFPGGVVAWLDERNASGWLSAPLSVARAMDAASNAIGVKGVGGSLRKRFADYFVGEDG